MMKTAGDFQVFVHAQLGISRGRFDKMADPAPGSAPVQTHGLPEYFDIPGARANHA